MKTKITLLVAVACMISTASFAQATFGAKAGLNFANVVDNGTGVQTLYKSKAGLNFGLFADFKVSDNFSVQPELNFSQMGAKVAEVGAEAKLNMNTIAIPLLAKFHIADLALMAGPQFAFITSAKIKSSAVGAPSESLDVKNDFKGSDFSLVFGAEYGLGDKLVAGARYQTGLSDINKPSTPGFTSKTNAFSLSIGYKFN